MPNYDDDLYIWSEFENSPNDVLDDKSKRETCEHDWTLYAGFLDTFEFCKKCNKKRGENE